MFADFLKTHPVRPTVDKLEGGHWYDLSRLSPHRHITVSEYIAQGFYSPELSDEVIEAAMKSQFYIKIVEPVNGLRENTMLVSDNQLFYHPSIAHDIIESLKITL